MQLRLACNSPHHFSWPWPPGVDPDSTLITASGKMSLLDRLVPPLMQAGHKIILFSQFSKQLDMLEDWATVLRGWDVCRIDGSVKAEDRNKQIATFNSNPESRLFLLSTRAGGLGINLTAADTVILFDSDWNPQQDLQAQDRAHRIGQTRPVIVYRLATKGTVEQTLLEKADGKRRLEKLVIQKDKFRSLLGRSTQGPKKLSTSTSTSTATNKDPNADADSDSDSDSLRDLLFNDDFENYNPRGPAGGEILTDKDLRSLMDRSEAAFARAESSTAPGEGAKEGGEGGKFRTVERKAGEEGGILGGLV